MKVHILGICGTFMGSLAVLAKQQGYEVSGSDANVYPPMSTQLASQGITLTSGYDSCDIPADVDQVIVGNVMHRGHPIVEYLLNSKIPYTSGPAWLAEHILRDRWVIAVSGTHGKTTTTSMVAWILECAGLEPGFLIGGVPCNFPASARLGKSPFFVIEADEYDSAFFDKRSKFIHYQPKTLILNNLEFDHADIFKDLESIQQQFSYLLRTVPGEGAVIQNAEDAQLQKVVSGGCWTPVVYFNDQTAWYAEMISPDGSVFDVFFEKKKMGRVTWALLGVHNVSNALAALAAAQHAGVAPEKAIQALSQFKNVKRRLEICGTVKGITVYDDFAHHPTAIATTVAGLRKKIGKAKLIAVLEFGSYTMRSGVHKLHIADALRAVDHIICKKPKADDWGLEAALRPLKQPADIFEQTEELLRALVPQLQAGDHVLIMSNSGFDGIHEKLINSLRALP